MFARKASIVQVVTILPCKITERLTGVRLKTPPEMRGTHVVKLYNVHVYVYILDLLILFHTRNPMHMNNTLYLLLMPQSPTTQLSQSWTLHNDQVHRM